MNKIFAVVCFIFIGINCMDKDVVINDNTKKVDRSTSKKITKFLSDTFNYNIFNFKIYVSRLKGSPNIRFKFVIPGVDTKIIDKNIKDWENPEFNKKIKALEILALRKMRELSIAKKDLTLRALDIGQDLVSFGTYEAVLYEEERKFKDILFDLANSSVDEFINDQEKLNVSFYGEKLKKWFLCKCCNKEEKHVVQDEDSEDIALPFDYEL